MCVSVWGDWAWAKEGYTPTRGEDAGQEQRRTENAPCIFIKMHGAKLCPRSSLFGVARTKCLTHIGMCVDAHWKCVDAHWNKAHAASVFVGFGNVHFNAHEKTFNAHEKTTKKNQHIWQTNQRTLNQKLKNAHVFWRYMSAQVGCALVPARSRDRAARRPVRRRQGPSPIVGPRPIETHIQKNAWVGLKSCGAFF